MVDTCLILLLVEAFFRAPSNGFACMIHLCRTSPSEFVIPYHKYVKAESNIPTVGSRFKMRFESEESAERRFDGYELFHLLILDYLIICSI